MRSYTVGRIWGIPIRISVSLLVFLPVLAWLIGSGQQIAVYAGLVTGFTGTPLDLSVLRAGTTPWLIGAVAALGLFVSVGIHELGHSWVAMRYGLSVESITLWILGGLANLGSIPREWNREFWIAVAGPITSILVGAVCYVVAVALPSSLPILVFVFGWLAVTNVSLAIFNMLPAFPMDGGRVFRALLARNRPYPIATRIAARVGSAFALLFVVVGVLAFSPLLLLLAIFLYGASTTESRMVMLDSLLEGLTVADLLAPDASTVDAGDSVASLLDRMLGERRTDFAVERGGSVVGTVSLSAVKAVPQDERGHRTVGDVTTEPTLRFDVEMDAFDAMSELSGSGDSVALVERDGRTVGVVSMTDFATMLQFIQSRNAERVGVRMGQ
ncbi:site-2 protease family protein [Haloarculaceae archaeon H-GB2-1]|nr:site-2 protease family protein [Haloarculaceae archaeon H-GB1-1]MEA5385779.1 site-2 protease family protein [Haloarculaceae archaeon H-GB11]MEA5407282.1 site-2 protease family protein [Haloarculaceae archaeon H-GB2-1]